MSITLRRITGTVALPDGTIPAHGRIEFELTGWDAEGPDLVAGSVISAALDSEGGLDVDLWSTANGGRGLTYAVRLHHFCAVSQAQRSVSLPPIFVSAGEGDLALADLLAIPAPAPDVPDALAQAVGAAAAAADSADAAADSADAAAAAAARVDLGEIDAARVQTASDASAAAASRADAVRAAEDAAIAQSDRRKPWAAITTAPTLAEINHIMQAGQSLSIGAQGTPIIHGTSLPANMLTFAGGVKAIPVAAGGTASATASFKGLVEDTNSPDAGAGRGETGLWSAAYALAEALSVETGSTATHGDFVFSTAGIGGKSLSYFVKSSVATSWWQQVFRGQLLAAKAVADGLGKTYAVPVILWAQGEANSGSTSSVEYYATTLRQLFDDMAAEVQAITGQAHPPHFVTYFTGYGTLEGHANTTNRAGTLGQLAVVSGALDVHQAAPVYAMPHAADGTHLTAEGYALLGRSFGEALADIIVRGRAPRQIWPVAAQLGEDLRTISVKYRAPEAGIVVDAASIQATANHGFAVRSSAGVAQAISSVAVSGDVATITLTSPCPDGASVRYACDARAAAAADPVGESVATGNVRAAGYDFAVHGSAKHSLLWSPPYIKPVLRPTSGNYWPDYEAVGAGGGHWLFDHSAGQFTDHVNALALYGAGGVTNAAAGLAVSGVYGGGLVAPIADASQLTICAVVKTTGDYAAIGGALSATAGSGLLLTPNGASAFSRSSGGSKTATAIHGAGSGAWRFLASVEDYAGAQLRARSGTVVQSLSLSGVTKTLNTGGNIGIGSPWWSNATYNKAFEIAEFIVFPRALASAEVEEVRLRSVARVSAALGATVV